jgi:hypothetical protein
MCFINYNRKLPVPVTIAYLVKHEWEFLNCGDDDLLPLYKELA